MTECVFDSTDPVLVTIAQELLTNKITASASSDASAASDLNKRHVFRLESFLTRARPCHKLFPSRIQKQRYARITVQERLVLASVVINKHNDDDDHAKETTTGGPVLVAGLEVLEYVLYPLLPQSQKSSSVSAFSTAAVERIVYIAKVDTSGCWPLPPSSGVDPRTNKSPAQSLVRGYLKAVRDGKLDRRVKVDDNDKESRVTEKKTSLFVFARAQPQYLFAESAKNPGKRVLDDRGLVRWWKNMIGSVYEEASTTATTTANTTMTTTTSSPSDLKAYWYIPGMDLERQAQSVIQQQYPQPIASSSPSSSGFNWIYGYPDKNSSEMAHTLIPQFPDDPKSRMMQSPSCQGGFVDIRTFWELTAIGEESGAGKITGFFRVIQEDKTFVSAEQETAEPAIVETVAAATTAATTTTAGFVATGSESQYTKMINYLLELDFSTLEKSLTSTKQWQNKIETWIEKSLEADQIRMTPTAVAETTSTEEKDSTTIDEIVKTNKELCQKQLWIQVKSVEVHLLPVSESNVQVHSTIPTAETGSTASPAVVHTLGAGLIKRKSSATTNSGDQTPVPVVVNTLGAGLIRRKTPSANDSTRPAAPVVNTLGAGLIRRKPATPDATTTTPAATANNTGSTPVVNLLGSNFIKKRKIDP